MSAMDGYAVRAADAVAGAILRVVGEALAGVPFPGTVGTDEAVRIATGGVVRGGADAILIEENATRDGEAIRVTTVPIAGQFVRPPGSDFAAGQRIADTGERLTPARLGLAAAANLARLAVARRPRVAILPNGDELREAGSPLRPGAIVNSAAYALEALVRCWGAEPVRLPILADDADACEAALAGDTSRPPGYHRRGLGWRARPVPPRRRAAWSAHPVRQGCGAAGQTDVARAFPDGRLLLGLPGNPASAFVCAQLFLKPLMFALTGCDPAMQPDEVSRRSIRASG